MAVTTSVQVVAGVGKELDTRRKTNNFLDRMNDTLFKPAGCYAFIMKYKSDAEVAQSSSSLLAKFGIGAEKVDFSTSKAIAKYDLSSSASAPSSSTAGSAGLAAKMQKIRLTSGETRGKNGEETFKDRAKDAQKFLAGYVDRRKQMSYVSFSHDPSCRLDRVGS